MSNKSVYEMVTDRIISELRQGIIPWEKPWHGVRSGAFNRISKKPYSLLNQMLLKHKGEYASYNQWQTVGGHVRKGEKAEIVVFWKLLPIEETNSDGALVTKQIPFLRYYSVFHVSQIDGVKPLEETDFSEVEPIEEIESVLNDYIHREHITLEHSASDKAYYSPSRDLIHLPLMEQFKEISEYYSTFAHEATHSTMKETRCDRRQQFSHFGSESYSKEELVAELGSASLLNMLGIETKNSFRNSVAYIQNWLEVLQSDPKFIVSAASKAEKAINFILNKEEVEG